MKSKLIIEEMIKKASELKAEYVKFQAYDMKKLNISIERWKELQNYYEEICLSHVDCDWEWDWNGYYWEFIFDKCEKYGVKPLVTIFNKGIVSKLHDIGYRYFKIGSAEAHKTDLITEVRNNGEHIIVSTGITDIEDICLQSKECEFTSCETDFLYCISKYPHGIADIDINFSYNHDGFSCHLDPMVDITHSYLKELWHSSNMMNKYLELHFTLSRNIPTRDNKVSFEYEEIKKIINQSENEKSDLIEEFKRRWM